MSKISNLYLLLLQLIYFHLTCSVELYNYGIERGDNKLEEGFDIIENITLGMQTFFNFNKLKRKRKFV